jgi:hypothetical protein
MTVHNELGNILQGSSAQVIQVTNISASESKCAHIRTRDPLCSGNAKYLVSCDVFCAHEPPYHYLD